MSKLLRVFFLFLLTFLILAFWFSFGNALTKKISGTTNVEDAFIRSSWDNYNYGGSDSLRTYPFGVNAGAILIQVKNVASELGANATSITAVCSLYCSVNTTDGDLSAYRVFKPWVEGDENGVDNNDGDVTWNDWASDAYEWGIAGCAAAYDTGHDNSGDGTNSDRKATAEGSAVSVTTASTWYAWTISTELATGWYNGSIAERGIIIPRNNDNNVFNSTENASNQPFFVFTYTTGAPPTSKSKLLLIREQKK